MSDMPPPPNEPSAPAVPPPPPASSVPVATGPLGQQRSTGLIVLLTIVTFGIWALVWSYQNGEEIKQHARTGLGGVAYLLITLFISPVTMFLMASEVEQLYRRAGKQPPITAIWGLWFLLPLIGNLIWYVRIQRSINEYWAMSASGAQPAR